MTQIIEIRLSPEQLHDLGYSPRNIVRLMTFRLQPDGTWISLDQTMLIQRPLVVGTLGGRHSKMEADYYLAGKVTPGQEAFDVVYDQMRDICRYAPRVEIHLMYTGLTETTLAAYSALIAYHMKFIILRYDDRARGYIPLDISKFWKDFKGA